MRVMSRARSGWVQSCPKHDPLGRQMACKRQRVEETPAKADSGRGPTVQHLPVVTDPQAAPAQASTAGKNEFADEGPHDLPRRHPCPDDTNIGSSPESAVDVTARHSR